MIKGDPNNGIYILSPALTGTRTLMINDIEGNNVLQLTAGLQIASSIVTRNTLRLTLSSGAKVSLYNADRFGYAVCGDARSGLNPVPVNFSTFAFTTLGVSVPTTASTSVYGGAKTIVCP